MEWRGRAAQVIFGYSESEASLGYIRLSQKQTALLEHPNFPLERKITIETRPTEKVQTFYSDLRVTTRTSTFQRAK